MMRDVVVIGGGVSGLATGHSLMAQGYDVVVLERQVRPGGNAISDRFDGWLMEHGPTTLNAAFLPPDSVVNATGLDRHAVPLGDGVQRRYLRDGDGLSGIGIGPLGFFRSDYLSPRAKLSMFGEMLRPRRRDGSEESLYDFAARRFGGEFAERVIEPMAAGIFMGDARRLTVEGAFPRLVDMEARFGSITRAVLASKLNRGVEPGRKLFSWREGIGALPARLAEGLGASLQTGVTVTSVRRGPDGFDIRTATHGDLRARTVVLAVPAHVAAELCETLDPECAEAIHGIETPPVAVAFLGYRRDQVAHPLDGLGFLSTRKPGQIVSGVQFCSTMFPGRTPEGHVSIAAYVGGRRAPEAARRPGAELIADVVAELSPLLGLSGDPVVSRVRHWAQGLPQYEHGHAGRRAVVLATPERVPGLWVTGNFLGGVSVTSCLEQAGQTAKALARHLREQDQECPAVPILKKKPQPGY